MPADVAAIVPPITIPLNKRLRRVGIVLLRCTALMYFIACTAMFFLQSYLIFPGTMRQGTADTVVHPWQGAELVRLKAADGTDLVGLFGTAETHNGAAMLDGAARPTLLFFYGNGEYMNSALMQFGMFRRMGVNCMLVDYAGFGMSGGKASEPGCYGAAEAAYQYLLTRPDVDRKRLVAAGWSLGGAVAIDLAHRHRAEGTICGLITFSTFTSMLDMAKLNYPFLPVSFFLQHHFLSSDKIREITVPYLIGHGKRDPAIPFAHADRLVAAYGGSPQSVTRFTSEAAQHNDFFDAGGVELETAIQQFLQQVTAK